METDNVVENADLTTVAPRGTALRKISSDNETIKRLVESDYGAEELQILERTSEYLDENSDDELDVVEPTISKLQSPSDIEEWASLKCEITQEVRCKSDIFVCGLCLKRFTYPHTVQRHMLEFHVAEKPCYKCSCDDAPYDTIDELMLHKAHYANKNTHIKCESCQMFFTTVEDLTLHKNRKKFYCSRCKTDYTKCNLLMDHWLHNNEVGFYACDSCGFKTLSCAAMKNHRAGRCPPPSEGAVALLEQRPKPATEYKCRFCGEMYTKPDQLARHQKLHHSNLLVYKCEVCGGMFDSDEECRWHGCAGVKQKLEDDEDINMQTMYQCNFCKDFVKPSHLRDHMSFVHYVIFDCHTDMLSCVKPINVLSVKQRKAGNKLNDTVKSALRRVRRKKKTGKNRVTQPSIAIKAEPSLDDELELETSNGTAFQACLENLMDNSSETTDRAVKTEDFYFDVDNEDFEDDIIILDSNAEIQYRREEPQTPEPSDTLQSIDEYLENNERLHTFSISVERVSHTGTPLDEPLKEADPGQSEDSLVAINQLLKVRKIFKHKFRKKPWFQCTNLGCNKVFMTKNDEKKHMVNMECRHMCERPYYQCLRCGVRTEDVLVYIKHWKNHECEEDQCPSCLVDTKGQLFPHVKDHLKESFDETTLACHECQLHITSRSQLQHWESHVLRREKGWNKGEKTKSAKALVKVCGACSKPFSRVSDLKRHLVEHILRDALRRKGLYRALKCELCGEASFATAGAFKHHWWEHADLRIYKCKMCTKTFADSSNFTKHKKVHDERCMQCDACHRKFASKRMLILHMEYHKTNEPLKCTACDKSFHFPSALTKHYKAKHKARRCDFKCKYCCKHFEVWRELRVHLWSHHGVRNGKADCQFCSMQYRTFMQLRKHCLAKHSIVIRKNEMSSALK